MKYFLIKDLAGGLFFLIPGFIFLSMLNANPTNPTWMDNYYVKLVAGLFCIFIAGVCGGLIMNKILNCESDDCLS